MGPGKRSEESSEGLPILQSAIKLLGVGQGVCIVYGHDDLALLPPEDHVALLIYDNDFLDNYKQAGDINAKRRRSAFAMSHGDIFGQ